MPTYRTFLVSLLLAALLLFVIAPVAALPQKPQTKMMANIAAPTLNVTYTVDQPPPYTPGETISVRFTVANPGPATAENIPVVPTANGLVFRPLEGPCKGAPCTIPYLRQDQQAVFVLTCLIPQAGNFNATLSASVGANAARTFSATFSGMAASPQAPANAAQANPTKSPAQKPEPAPGNQQPAAPAEISTGKAVVIVQARLITPGPFHPGQNVAFLVQVTNRGTRIAPHVNVSGTPENLTLSSVGEACWLNPCSFSSLAPGASRSFKFGATILAAGNFSYTAQVLSPVSDIAGETSRAGASTFADTRPTPPSNWIWVAALLAIVAAVALSRFLWPVPVSVTASLDPAASISTVSPLSFPSPTIHVQASLTFAAAPPPTDIPILRQEITHD